MLNALLNFVYPPNCPACGIRLPIETERCICAACDRKDASASIESRSGMCSICERTGLLDGPGCHRCGIPFPVRALNAPDAGIAAELRQGPRRCRATRRTPTGKQRLALGDHSPAQVRPRSIAGRALAECIGATLPSRGEHRPGGARSAPSRALALARLQPGCPARRRGGAAGSAASFDASCLERVRATPPQTARDHGSPPPQRPARLSR